MLCHLLTIMPDYLRQCWQQPVFLCCPDTPCVNLSHLPKQNMFFLSPFFALLRQQVRLKSFTQRHTSQDICCKEDQDRVLITVSFKLGCIVNHVHIETQISLLSLIAANNRQQTETCSITNYILSQKNLFS